jgi:hypothetical protein
LLLGSAVASALEMKAPADDLYALGLHWVREFHLSNSPSLESYANGLVDAYADFNFKFFWLPLRTRPQDDWKPARDDGARLAVPYVFVPAKRK